MGWFDSGRFKRRKRFQSKDQAVEITSIAGIVTENKIEVIDTEAKVVAGAADVVSVSTVATAPFVSAAADTAIKGTTAAADINFDIIEADNGKAYVVNEKGVWTHYNTANGVTVQDASPSGTLGDLWFNKTDEKLYYFKSTGWLLVSEQPPKFAQLRNTSDAVITRAGVGNTIRVIGENFKGGSIVYIGATAATTTYISDIRLDIIIPAGAAGAVHAVKIENSSGLSATGIDAFTYNRVPSFNASGDMGTHTSGATVTITANAADGDGDGLTYALTGGSLPTGTSLNTSTGAITGAPGANVGGTFNWTLSVTDGIDTATASFSALLVPTYEYKDVYAYGFTTGGYKGAGYWKNVNRTTHSNDTTANLGDKLDRDADYLDGSWSDVSEKQYIYCTGHSSSTFTSRYNLRTDTGLGSHDVLGTARDSLTVTTDLVGDIGYLHGGDASHCTKYTHPTESAISNVASGGVTGNHAGSIQGEHRGQINGDTSDMQFIFSSESYTAWSSQGHHGCMKGLSSKKGYGYISRGGGCNGDNGFDKYNNDNGSHISGVHTRPMNTAGEENYHIGQDKGYMIGNYDGAPHGQNNLSFVWYYSTNSGSMLGSAGEPKGHDGMSSGAGCSRKG